MYEDDQDERRNDGRKNGNENWPDDESPRKLANRNSCQVRRITWSVAMAKTMSIQRLLSPKGRARARGLTAQVIAARVNSSNNFLIQVNTTCVSLGVAVV